MLWCQSKKVKTLKNNNNDNNKTKYSFLNLFCNNIKSSKKS